MPKRSHGIAPVFYYINKFVLWYSALSNVRLYSESIWCGTGGWPSLLKPAAFKSGWMTSFLFARITYFITRKFRRITYLSTKLLLSSTYRNEVRPRKQPLLRECTLDWMSSFSNHVVAFVRKSSLNRPSAVYLQAATFHWCWTTCLGSCTP